ncbi:hypothetical protein PIB30_097410 [Stylosanthes scabra]|uniref:Uncharacterized protein n=1 Tax=Stylosanthes scabra TaxID=79078 RepID=A0ABU6SX66_9FABA|nr:hypothetical protein [Stylosanthes scabra]
MEISFLASGPVEAMPKARSITPAVMENIRHPPVQPFNPQQHYHHEQPADGYGWGQLQEDMANMSKNQTEFYDSMLAQQTAYGLCLQEMETRQQEMWQFQQEVWQAQYQFQQDVRNYQEQQRKQFQSFQKEQEKMQKELTNYKKNFSRRPLFHGMLRPWPPEGSSNALGQQATPAVDVQRNPNANADDED